MPSSMSITMDIGTFIKLNHLEKNRLTHIVFIPIISIKPPQIHHQYSIVIPSDNNMFYDLRNIVMNVMTYNKITKITSYKTMY